MLSGNILDLAEPNPKDIQAQDIALGLSRLPRWNGQTKGQYLYSVAQHSLLAESIAQKQYPYLSKRQLLTVLLHDAPEYVIGDMISPFKNIIGTVYEKTEEKLMSAILEHFDIPPEIAGSTHDIIKDVDKQSAYIEAIQIAGFSEKDARTYIYRAGYKGGVIPDIENISPAMAEAKFLERLNALS